MADEYPLSALIQVRERERDRVEADLAEAVGAVEHAKREVSDLEQEIESKSREVAENLGRERDRLDDTLDLSMVAQRGSYERAMQAEAARLSADLACAKTRLSDAIAAEADVRDELVEAERELEAVKKHREGWQDERALVQKRRDSAAMDDIAIARWEKERE